jgi:hypothetical protein
VCGLIGGYVVERQNVPKPEIKTDYAEGNHYCCKFFSIYLQKSIPFQMRR